MKKISRRLFVEGTGVGIVAATVPLVEAQQQPEAKAPTSVAPSARDTGAAPRSTITVTVNGQKQSIEVEDRWTLVEVLRDHLNLTGTKIGCDRGECGACTVLIDGKAMYACSQLAAWMDGRTVQTVEGLAKSSATGEVLDPLQEAFIAHDAPQCGYCTSGQLMAARALLNANPKPTREQVRAGMTGNLCRCSNYNHYVEAVMAASGASGSAGGKA